MVQLRLLVDLWYMFAGWSKGEHIVKNFGGKDYVERYV
jgi:hypothetical protein